MTQVKSIPLFIIALALALNLYSLSADSFWGDEILTATFASRSPADLIRWTARDIHPPLYYLVTGAFTDLMVPLGSPETIRYPTRVSDWLWRFPSVVAVVLTVVITYRLAHHISTITFYVLRFTPSPSSLATQATLLFSFAPIAIKYGQEARMHALFMLFSALSTWLFLRALKQPQRPERWLAFALATTANIYTMYFGFLILAAQAGLLLGIIINAQLTNTKFDKSQGIPARWRRYSIQHPTRRGDFSNPLQALRDLLTLRFSFYVLRVVAGFVIATIFAFLLYLPWWPVLFDILQRRAAVGAIEGGVGAPITFVTGVVDALGPMPGLAAWLHLGLFTLGLFFMARHYWPLAFFALLWLGLPILLPVVLGDPRALQFRYAFVLPIYLAVIAYGVAGLSHLNYFSYSRLQGRGVLSYLFWLLITVSMIGLIDIYQQVKPGWRSAAAYLDNHTGPTDIILIGPLWDEGRFIDYYYRGQAQLLTPAAMVTNIERRAAELRAYGGRVWAVNRFAPRESPALRNLFFSGVVISEPQLVVYEPSLLTEAAIDLATQAVEAAYPWAAEAQAQGVLDPDPRTARAAALRAWGDALMAAGQPQEATAPYQTAVNIFPGWVEGFVALAEAHQAAGNLPAAAEAYQQAVIFNPKWQGPQANEAAALVRAGEWGSALEKYHLIIGQ